jgi:hypothetical protein
MWIHSIVAKRRSGRKIALNVLPLLSKSGKELSAFLKDESGNEKCHWHLVSVWRQCLIFTQKFLSNHFFDYHFMREKIDVDNL